jgi:hypothetical protein
MAEQEEREVNTGPVVESETLKPELEEEEDVEDEEDEEDIIPPQDLEESTEESPDEEGKEEKEPQEEPASESSPEEQEEVPVQLKSVEGETEREKALRFEVTRLKKERRDQERQAMLGNEKPPKQEEDIYGKLREKYSDEEIKNSEELIDTIAKSKGYVRKDEAYQNTANQVLDGFLDANPEYKAENDSDDLRWNAFKRNISDYNLMGKTASQLLSIYKKADRDVKIELGETSRKATDPRKIETQKQKIHSVSHSGGNKTSSKKELDIDPAVRAHFKGFNDDDF